MRKEASKKNTGNYRYSYSPHPFSCDFTTNIAAGNMEFHMHNRHEIYFLVDGNVQYFVENGCYTLSSGNLILFSTDEIHKAINMNNTPFTRLVIHVNPDFVQQYCTPQTNLLSCFHRKPGEGNLIALSAEEQAHLLELAHSLEKRLRSPQIGDNVNRLSDFMLHQSGVHPSSGAKDPVHNGSAAISLPATDHAYGSDILAITEFLQILILINKAWKRTSTRAVTPAPHRAQAIMNYIDSHLTDDLTLDSIAKALSLDKYYLSHLFKSATESSIFQYVLIKRVSLAKQLLSQGHTVSEACYLSGFHDYSNFIRSFKQITGYTPGQFKRSVL